jgi:hypothetical protein
MMALTSFVPVKFRLILFIAAISIIIFILPIYSYQLYRKEKK